jgi:hypothetical protein
MAVGPLPLLKETKIWEDVSTANSLSALIVKKDIILSKDAFSTDLTFLII